MYKGTVHDFSDTSKMRGMWKAMLDNAAGADQSGDYNHSLIVCAQFRRHQEYFACLDCKEHFGNYLAAHPPEAVIHEPDGLFYWTIEFHNSVSERIGKDYLDSRIAYPMFHTPGVDACATRCNGAEGPATSVPKITRTRK